MRIVAIATVADNDAIGSGEGMPWHIPAGFRRSEAVTTENTIIFGRRTHEQIGLLSNCRMTAVTWQPDWSAEGVGVAHSIEEAIRLTHTTPGKTCFISGGGEIYVAAWSYLTELDVIHVHQEPERAATFPVVTSHEWTEISREIHEGYGFMQCRPTPVPE